MAKYSLPQPIPLPNPYSLFRGFNFIRPIRIENSGTVLRDYQVKITLTQDNFPFEKCRPDGADIRFRDDSGEIVSYWIESWSNNQATIWCKIPYIPEDSSSLLWMVYGNPTAESLSNPLTTFDFYDDFSGIHSLSDYMVVDEGTGESPSDWELDTVNKKIIQHSNIFTANGGETFGSALLTGLSISDFEITIKTKEVDDDIIGMLFCYTDTSHFYHYSYTNDYAGVDGSGTTCARDTFRWLGKDDDAHCVSSLADDTSAPGVSDTVTIKIRRYGDSIKVLENGNTIFLVTDSSHDEGDIGLMTDGCAEGEFLSPFIVRKYTYPEPTIIL